MVQEEAQSVISFLKSCGDGYSERPYDIRFAVEICREHKLMDLLIWLLVQNEEYSNALKYALADLKKFCEIVDEQSRPEESLEVAIQVCFAAGDSVDSSTLWYLLLDAVCFDDDIYSPLVEIRALALSAAMSRLTIPEILIRDCEVNGSREIRPFQGHCGVPFGQLHDAREQY